MIKSKNIVYGVFASLFFSLGAHASGLSLTAEPYLGYTMGSMSQTTVESNQTKTTTDLGSLKGLGFGARALVEFQGLFFVGPDFSYSKLGYAASDQFITNIPGLSKVVDNGTSRTTLGVVAGVELPILPLRFWVGYNFLDQLNSDCDVVLSQAASQATGLNSVNQKYDYSGTSFKVGAGYKILPFLSANLEYIRSSYSSYTDVNNNNKVTELTNGASYSTSTWMLSVSAPLSALSF